MIGCYQDDSTVRDLDGSSWNDPTVTPFVCQERCDNQGFAFAGVQDGDWCYCGNSYARYGAATDCSSACAGNFWYTCGGPYSNEVYAAASTVHSCEVLTTSFGSPPWTVPWFRDLAGDFVFFTGAYEASELRHALKDYDTYTQLAATTDECADRCFGTPGCHRFIFHSTNKCEIVFSSRGSQVYIYPATDHLIYMVSLYPSWWTV